MHRDPRFEVDDLTRVVRLPLSEGPALDHIDIDDSTFLFSAHFKRSGADLILTGDGHKLILADYFTLAKRPDLTSHGATISADLVAQLAGPNAPGQYAQAGAPAGAVVIGRCERLGGGASVQHANGVEEDLKVGDAILRGDVVMTSDGSSAVLSLLDGTVFDMGSSARMVLNELLYDPNSASNSAFVSLVKGTFSFVAGQVAHTGDMKVDTPVTTVGIRGTTVHAIVNADPSGAAYEVDLSLMPDPDGHVGRFQALERVTGAVLGELSSTTSVLSVTTAGAQENPKSAAQVQAELAAAQILFPIYLAVAAAVVKPPAPPAPAAPGGPPTTIPPLGSLETEKQTPQVASVDVTIDTATNTVQVTNITLTQPTPLSPSPALPSLNLDTTNPSPPPPPTIEVVPEIIGDLAITLSKGGSVVLTTVDLRGADPDKTASELTFGAPAAGQLNGHLALGNSPGAQITSFTEAQLEAGQVIFVHDGSSGSSASFSVSVTGANGLTSPTSTVIASVTQVEANLWGEMKFPDVVPGRHIFTPNVQVNSIGGFVVLGYTAALNYNPVNDPQGPYARPQYMALSDPFLLPDQPAALQIASNTVTLPARMFTITPNLGGTAPEAIVASVKQTNADGSGTDVINRSVILQNSNGTLTKTDLGQVGSAATTGATIFNLTESFSTGGNGPSGTMSSYDISWDQYNSTTHTYQVYFQTFNPDNSASASLPVLTSVNLTNVSTSDGEPVLPAWEFRSGFGGYALASPISSSTQSNVLGLTGQTYQAIHFQSYDSDGTLDSNLANFTVRPNLIAHPGATNTVTQQVIPSLGDYPGQTAAQLQFVQTSSANGFAVGVAWNETVTYTDQQGRHTYDQVEFLIDKSGTIFRPIVGGGSDPSGVAILSDAQNIRLDSYSDPQVSGQDDFVLVYGDETGTYIKEYGITTTNNVMSVTLLVSVFDPTIHAFANMRALGDGRVVVTYDNQLASDQSSQLDLKIFDLRTGPVTFDGQNNPTHHDNYIAGTSFDGDSVIGENGNVNNTYYFVGGPTAPHDSFEGGLGSGWNTAIFPDPKANYSIHINADNTDIANVGDPAHGGTLTMDGAVQALAFAPTLDPTPGNNGGVAHASGDELLIQGNVTNWSHVTTFAIDGTATLEFAGAVSDSVSVTFDAPGGILKLDQPANFDALVHGFGASFIDFVGVSSFDTLFRSYDRDSNVTSLSLGHDDVTDATIALAGDYSSTTFFVNDNGHGGTLVDTDHAPQASYVNVAIDATLVHAGTGMTIPGGLLAHFGTDTDPGDQLSLVSVDGSQTQGQVYETQSGDVVYTPPGSFVAPTGPVQTADDQFSFTLADNAGLTSTGHVALTAQGGTQIVGTTGHDLIMGASGDTLTGMGGDDVFVFQLNSGNQTIGDFHQGQDQVDLSAFYLNQTPQQAAQALQSIIDATTPGAHDLTLAANDTITFAGIEVHQLSASNDFILSHGA